MELQRLYEQLLAQGSSDRVVSSEEGFAVGTFRLELPGVEFRRVDR
jgi:hypothetical protein